MKIILTKRINKKPSGKSLKEKCVNQLKAKPKEEKKTIRRMK